MGSQTHRLPAIRLCELIDLSTRSQQGHHQANRVGSRWTHPVVSFYTTVRCSLATVVTPALQFRSITSCQGPHRCQHHECFEQGFGCCRGWPAHWLGCPVGAANSEIADQKHRERIQRERYLARLTRLAQGGDR